MKKKDFEYEVIDIDGDITKIVNIDLNPDLTKVIDKNDPIIEVIQPDEVRWFFRSVNHSKKNDFRAFSDYDSLRLETKYRELSAFKGISYNESENEKIVVKESLFEADVIKKNCIPIYWADPDDEYDIFRGTWFLLSTYEPLNEQLSNAIESIHMMNFGNISSSLANSVVNKKRKVICSLKYCDYWIKWFSYKEIYLYDTKSVKYAMRKVQLSDGGIAICRGYKHRCVFDKRPLEITHLCFVVHGIGQNLGGQIQRQCHKLKKGCKKVVKKLKHEDKSIKFRIEFIPIEWRSFLNLDGGIIDSVTPREFKGIRTIFNGTVMDILYYSSSMYQIEIAYALESEINRLYSMFCARNPYFESNGGQLSILAHSLGTVICYDVMRSWANSQSNNTKCEVIPSNLIPSDSNDELTSKIKNILSIRAKLKYLEDDVQSYLISQPTTFRSKGLRSPNFPTNFKEGSMWKKIHKIDNFFMLGSPLPVFLALRGIKPHGLTDHSDILPKSVCSRIFNIYYPSDPIAYRLEPLVILEYCTIHPVKIETKMTLPNIEITKDVFFDNLSNDAMMSSTLSSVSLSASTTSSVSVNSNKIELNISQSENQSPIHDVRFLYERKISSTDPISDVCKTLRKVSVRRRSIIPAVDELKTKLQNLKSYPLLKRVQMFLKIMKGQDTVAYPVELDTETDNNKDQSNANNNSNNNNEGLTDRLDYTLGKDSAIDSFLSLFTSHTSYWNDNELVEFIVNKSMS